MSLVYIISMTLKQKWKAALKKLFHDPLRTFSDCMIVSLEKTEDENCYNELHGVEHVRFLFRGIGHFLEVHPWRANNTKWQRLCLL